MPSLSPARGELANVQWQDSFSDVAVNSRYVVGNSVGTVVDTNSGAGSLRIRTTGTAITGYLDWGRAFLYLPGALNFELTLDVLFNGSVEQYLDLSLRADNGTATGDSAVAANCYNFEMSGVSVGSWINLASGGTLTANVVTESTSPQPGNGTLTKVRINVYNEYIRSKQWTSTTTASEPRDWSITYIDRTHFLAAGREWFGLGALGGSANGINMQVDNYTISRLNLGRLWSDRRTSYYVASSGTAYSDSVTTTIVVDTSGTVDQLSMFESLATTGVGVTSDVDTAAFQDSPVTTAVGVTSETDVAAFLDTPTTTAVAVTSNVDQLSMFEFPATTGVVVTGEVDQLSLFESLTTTAVGVTSDVDTAAYTEPVSTNVAVITGVGDVAAFIDSINDNITALTGEVDQLMMFETPTTTGVVTTSETDQLALFEFPSTTAVAVTSESDTAAYVEPLNTTAVVVTAEDDILNGNPTPGIGFIYQTGPWKVLGRL